MLFDEPEALMIKAIFDRFKNIQYFVKQKPRPKKMEVIDFQKLYKAGDLRWKCLLALGINCSFTLIDVCNLLREEVSLERRFMEKNREKTGEYRYAYFHDLTIKFLK